PAAQREALRLLAVFVQHSDNKAANQRLVCEATAGGDDRSCPHPLMYVGDLGSTFGRGNLWRQKSTARANFEEWSSVPVWKGDATCETHLGAGIRGGTLHSPEITEAGRKFLADLLVQLTDDQIRDMF